ncbi:MAG: RluA family pseudouridine synthase, partial [Candidatus Omnitrophota bacterium]
LARCFPEAGSRSAVHRLIDKECVKVNGRTVKAHHKVREGEQVLILFESQPVSEDAQVKPELIPLDILYEDDSILMINKPEGMLVHPARGQNSGTLVNALLYHCKTLSTLNEVNRPGIVHRLDRETSGLIVAVKNNQAHANLAKQFEKHKVYKKYLALVKGCVELDEGEIDAPIARHAVYFDKKAVSFDAESSRPAKTFYKVIKRYGTTASLVALFPKTGRTHQLRVHMKFLGHPILGDEKYGIARGFPRLALHAQAIRFYHPQKYYLMEFSVPPPNKFRNIEQLVSE